MLMDPARIHLLSAILWKKLLELVAVGDKDHLVAINAMTRQISKSRKRAEHE